MFYLLFKTLCNIFLSELISVVLGFFICSIEEPEDARDQFHLARLNCKKFAFVHVAFAQFELSQGL